MLFYLLIIVMKKNYMWFEFNIKLKKKNIVCWIFFYLKFSNIIDLFEILFEIFKFLWLVEVIKILINEL